MGPAQRAVVGCPPQRHQTSGTTTRLILGHVRARGGDAAVDAVVARSEIGRTPAELEDEQTWSSYADKIALFEAAASVLEDPLVARHIGETVLDHRVGPGIRLLLRAAGSPRQVVRNVARAAAKFSSVCSMEAVEVGRTSATVRYRLHDGLVPSPMDCQYNQGLLSQIPALFGLPAATVWHPECQVEGAPACVYRLRWTRRRGVLRGRRGARAAVLEDQIATLVERTESLQLTAVDLVAPTDIDTVLRRIATRAGAAVSAPRYLLIIADPPRMLHSGLDDEEAVRLSGLLLSGETCEIADTGMPSLVVDVASSRRWYGRLAAFNQPGADFFPTERRVFAAYARYAAAALDAAAALEESRRSEDTARALLELARTLARVTTPAEVARRLADAAPRVVGSERAVVMLWDGAEQVLVTGGVSGFDGTVLEDLLALRIPLDSSPLLTAMVSEPRALTVEGGDADTVAARLMARFDSGPTFVVPITSRDEFLGIIGVANTAGHPAFRVTDEVTERIAGLADQAATALENARLLEHQRRSAERFRRIAASDHLTGLPNRREFDRFIAQLPDHDCALLAIDVDNLKIVNDHFGHEAGDQLLRTVATALRESLRDADLVARVGGDEFAVVLASSDETEARTVAERLRGSMHGIATPHGPARVSIGCALMRAGTEVRSALAAADDALYRAKASGRDRVEWAMGPAPGRGPAMTRQRWDALLPQIIAAGDISAVFQPVVDLRTRAITGYEALARPPDISPSGDVEEMFATAHRIALHRDLDWLCRRVAVHQAGALPPGTALFLNVGTGLLLDPVHDVDQMLLLLDSAGRSPSDVVLELTEREKVDDRTRLRDVLVAYRSAGFRFAIDDIGDGHSTLELLAAAKPEYMKISGRLIRHHREPGAYAAIMATVAFARVTGGEVIAEGIETELDAQVSLEMGIGCGQGFALGPPVTADVLSRLRGEDEAAS